MQHVLVPIDFSEDALYALDHAIELARPFGACVHLLHVLDSSVLVAPALGDVTTQREPERFLREAEEALEEIAARLVRDLPTRSDVRLGSAPDHIVAYSREHAVDLIVMGTHGSRGPSRFLLGGTAEKVVRFAECPVMSVRHPRRWIPDEEPAVPEQGRARPAATQASLVAKSAS